MIVAEHCPFCGWEKSQTNPQRVGQHHRKGENYQVVCNKCRARGPLAKTPEDAVRGWNKAAMVIRSGNRLEIMLTTIAAQPEALASRSVTAEIELSLAAWRRLTDG